MAKDNIVNDVKGAKERKFLMFVMAFFAAKVLLNDEELEQYLEDICETPFETSEKVLRNS